MNKMIAAVAVTVGTLLGAGAAHADPSSDTVALKQVCRMLDSESPDQVVDILMRDHGGSLDTDRTIVAYAIKAYCPNHKVPDWQWTN